jgi:hypothetical protein
MIESNEMTMMTTGLMVPHWSVRALAEASVSASVWASVPALEAVLATELAAESVVVLERVLDIHRRRSLAQR